MKKLKKFFTMPQGEKYENVYIIFPAKPCLIKRVLMKLIQDLEAYDAERRAGTALVLPIFATTIHVHLNWHYTT